MSKKSPFKPISYYHRRIVFDGHGKLKCERCGACANVPNRIDPKGPRARYDWVVEWNAKIETFLKKHKECK